MQLSLEQLIPIPLADKLRHATSQVWMKKLLFAGKECVFLQAPSGTGKTTLMHFLYGLRTDYSGQLKWDGKTIGQYDSTTLSELRARDVSFVFQDLRLFPTLTAWENLEVKRTLTNTIDKKTVEDWMHRLGVEHKMHARADTLSYGEQQRVAIIRALLQPYKWLLMDEPFSHLDNANIQKATDLITEVTQANNAGLMLADLEDNDYFPYTQKLLL